MLRYLSHPGPVVKRNLLWYDRLLRHGGRKLIITEGPFDALKVDYAFNDAGVPNKVTCTFGVSYTPEQLDQIRELSTVFDKVVILFDDGAMGVALTLQRDLRDIQPSVAHVPRGVKDPGMMTVKQVLRLK